MEKSSYYSEDIVEFKHFKKNKEKFTYLLGTVLKGSQDESSDDDSDDSDYSYKPLKKDRVRVEWYPNGNVKDIPHDKLKLVDRSLMPGDVVKKAHETENPQNGYVSNSHIVCLLNCLNKPALIFNIASSQLEPLIKYHDYVYMDCWVGTVRDYDEEIKVKFSDGARCEQVISSDFKLSGDLRDVNFMHLPDYPDEYYAGQILRGKIEGFADATWTKSSIQHNAKMAKKHKNRLVTVEVIDLSVKVVRVDWICRGYSDSKNSSTKTPPASVQGEDLARLMLLDCYETNNFKMGDRAYLTLKEGSKVINLKAKTKQNEKIRYYLENYHKKIQEKVATGSCLDIKDLDDDSFGQTLKTLEKKSSDFDVVSLEFNNVETPSDENNQTSNNNVTQSNGCEGVTLDQSTDLTANNDEVCGAVSSSTPDFIDVRTSMQRVRNRGWVVNKKFSKFPMKKRKTLSYETNRSPNSLKVGQRVAVEIISTMTIVDVVWQDGSEEKGIASIHLLPVPHINDLEFFPGDYVVPNNAKSSEVTWDYGVVRSVDHKGRTCVVKWLSSLPGLAHQRVGEEEVSVFDLKDHPGFSFRPGVNVVRVGGFEMVDNKNDEVEVEDKEIEKKATGDDRGENAIDVLKEPIPQTMIGNPATSSSPKEELIPGDVGKDVSRDNQVGGQVYRLETDGKVLVRWADGSFSSCQPDHLFIVDAEFSQMGSLESGDDESSIEMHMGVESECSDTDLSDSSGWETEDEQEVSGEKTSKKDTNLVHLKTIIEGNLILTKTTISKINSFIKTYNIPITAVSPPIEASALNTSDTSTSPTLNGSVYLDAQSDFSEQPSSPTSTLDSALSADNRHTSSPIFDKLLLLSAQKNEPNSSTLETALKSTSDNISSPLIHAQNSSSIDPSTTTFSNSLQTSEQDKTCELRVIIISLSILMKSYTEVIKSYATIPKLRMMLFKVKYPLDLFKKKINPAKKRFNMYYKMRQLYEKNCKKDGQEEVSVDDEAFTEDLNSFLAFSNALLSHFQEVLSTIEKEIVAKEENKLKEDEEKKKDCKDEGEKPATMDHEVKETSEEVRDKEDVPPERRNSSDSSSSWCSAGDTPAIEKHKTLEKKGFHILEAVPPTHHFITPVLSNTKLNHGALLKEMQLLKTCLTDGIYVKAFEDRMDLFSVMVCGPTGTPYEGGMFFFDVRLTSDYPHSPPKIHYYSYCSDRLNPNLYEDGKVCISLLGTWSGKGTEVWSQKHSNLLQVLLSIQGLILNREPYFNEAGYEKQKGGQQAAEDSRLYNEMAIVKLVQSNTKILSNPYSIFEKEINEHFQETSKSLLSRLQSWIDPDQTSAVTPSFPLMPVSKGFRISLQKALDTLKKALEDKGFIH